MSKIINGTVNENALLTLGSSTGYVGEQNAEMLCIDVSAFGDDPFDFYVIKFSVSGSSGIIISNEISSSENSPAYIDDGKIYCPLDSVLTGTGRLDIQLEGHIDGGEEETVVKSSVARLSFKPSIMGRIRHWSTHNSVYLRLRRLEESLSELLGLEGRIESLENSDDDETDDGLSETVAGLEERVTALESEPGGITEIPLATETTVGGIIAGGNSALRVRESGEADFVYSKMNYYALAAMVTAILCMDSNTTVIIGEKVSDIADEFQNAIEYIQNVPESRCIIISEESGTLDYMDLNWEDASVSITANCAYLFCTEDGELVWNRYSGGSLRDLLFLQGGVND